MSTHRPKWWHRLFASARPHLPRVTRLTQLEAREVVMLHLAPGALVTAWAGDDSLHAGGTNPAQADKEVV